MKFRELRIQKPRRPPTASELHFPVRIKVKRWPDTAKPYPLSAIYDPYRYLKNRVQLMGDITRTDRVGKMANVS